MTFHTRSGSLTRLLDFLQTYSVTDVILPFLLIFTILFAILQQIKLFGEEKKNINIALSLLISAIAVIPHVTGRYPSNYDPVVIINALIPSAAVLAIAIILVLLLMGMWGFELGKGVPAVVIALIVGVLFYVFGSTVGWWDVPGRWFNWWDDDLTIAVIVILVFGLIIYFITRKGEPSSGFKDFMKEAFKPRR
jgi:hypothetical protein